MQTQHAWAAIRHLAPLHAFELLVSGVLILALLKLLSLMHHHSNNRTLFTYVPWTSISLGSTAALGEAPAVELKHVVVVDCSCRRTPTLTHHKDNNNPEGLPHADTSTGLVLHAIKAGYWRLGGASAWLTAQQPHVTTNHFDVDAFLSCWCYIHRTQALQAEPVLRHMARIGDFREAFLSPELVAAYGKEDGLTTGMVKEAFTALKLVCWLNTVERQVFSRPYEVKDCTEKFEYFLPRFGDVLADPEQHFQEWETEYKQVVGGFDQLQSPSSSVEQVRNIGLVIISSPEPQHYYSLFSLSIGFDVVLTMYDHRRYELECKYTQFVNMHSRPVWPRIELLCLAQALNKMDDLPTGVSWSCSRFTDSGPLLRLDRHDAKLNKAQRYGHPTERPIYSSSLEPATFSAIVQSYLEFGLQGHKPKTGGWTWDELTALNDAIPWDIWTAAVLEQHNQGQLSTSPTLLSLGLRRAPSDGLPLLPPRGSEGGGDDGDITGSSSSQLSLGLLLPKLTSTSALMSAEDVLALAAAVPSGVRLASGQWSCVYSTARDGVSLHTLYRKAAGRPHTLLLVREAGAGGHIFGAYAPEPWRIGSRFYGTGETFVFRLQPRPTRYPWRRLKEAGDFFQFSTHEGLGVGGHGHFAFWLDNDLLEGSSAACDTFGSPCLASHEDFSVAEVELWHLG